MKRVSSCSQKHPMTARREFLVRTASLATTVATLPGQVEAAESLPALRATEATSLSGEWLFCTDPQDRGTKENWFATNAPRATWLKARVPHTWQVQPSLTEYRGVAWYWRRFDAPERWAGSVVRIEFEAVYHTATVWVNGRHAGEHAHKGYTAFTLDISRFLHLGSPNSLVVRVDNSFNEHMLPRGRSSDFPHDGGIFRPVRLLGTPATFVEQLDVDALPDSLNGEAQLAIVAHCRNMSLILRRCHASFRVI